jgi:arsenate reductase
MTIWHNNRCSKSREAKKILENTNDPIIVFEYLTESITKADLLKIKNQLGFANIKDLLRSKETEYKTFDIKNIQNEDQIIEIVLKNPKLIERPIIIQNDTAIIARPMQNLLNLLGLT